MSIFSHKEKGVISFNELKRKMIDQGFDDGIIEEFVLVFRSRITELGEEGFSKWLLNLHYSTPLDFRNEEKLLKIYSSSMSWIEREVQKMEKETKLSWEIQAEDLGNLDERVRKTQLVIRQRLSDVVWGLRDDKRI